MSSKSNVTLWVAVLIVNHRPVKFGSHRDCGSGDINIHSCGYGYFTANARYPLLYVLTFFSVKHMACHVPHASWITSKGTIFTETFSFFFFSFSSVLLDGLTKVLLGTFHHSLPKEACNQHWSFSWFLSTFMIIFGCVCFKITHIFFLNNTRHFFYRLRNMVN